MDGKGASKDWTEENITRVALFFYEIEVAGRHTSDKNANWLLKTNNLLIKIFVTLIIIFKL